MSWFQIRHVSLGFTSVALCSGSGPELGSDVRDVRDVSDLRNFNDVSLCTLVFSLFRFILVPVLEETKIKR